MIAPLRRAHRRILVTLSLGLPLLFVSSMFVRTETPRVDLPAELELGRVALPEAPIEPDPLLYWSAAPVRIGQSLPGDARLLGAVRSGLWLAWSPELAELEEGTLFVYSLLDQEVTALIGEGTDEGKAQ
jgi:hypothetical protein